MFRSAEMVNTEDRAEVVPALDRFNVFVTMVGLLIPHSSIIPIALFPGI